MNARSTQTFRPALLAWLPAMAIGLASVSVAGATYYWPPQTGQVAVVFPFGTTTATAMALVLKAGGRFISTTQLDNVIVAYASDSQFAARVHDTGALFLLAGRGLCGPPNQQDSQ